MGPYNTKHPRELWRKATETALQALEIDSELAEAHTSLAIIKMQYDWDWSGAESEFKRAIKLNPADATTHYWYSIFQSVMQRPDEALAESRRALQLDPLSLPVNQNVARSLYYLHQLDLAIQQCQITIDMDRTFSISYSNLGLALEQKRMYPEAIEAFQKAIELTGGAAWSLASLGHAYAVAGRRAEAMGIIDKLKNEGKQEYVPAFHLAAIYNGLGDKDQTFAWLEQAYTEHSNLLLYLRMEPEFDNLRNDKRFIDLMHRLGFSP
jgi:tetratricopeptide (TPR) repeat protein